jgi:hypothetical protein
MAEKGKGKIMGRPSCGWVHGWLPLLVDDGDGLARDDNNLDTQDRRLIEWHLEQCSRCRRHQTELGKVISVLNLAATETTEPRTPSLWPTLEERIQRHQEQCRSQWLRILRATCPEGIRVTMDRLLCGYGQVRCNLPLQLAWTRDSLGDFLAKHVWPMLRSKAPSSDKAVVLSRAGLCLGLAAACMVLLLLFVTSQRRPPRFEARIVADRVPPPRIQLPLPELPEASDDDMTAVPLLAVARGAYSPPPESQAAPLAAASMGQVAPTKTASTTSTTTAMETSAPRYDFDLEHGTPMPPDSRTSKPAY